MLLELESHFESSNDLKKGSLRLSSKIISKNLLGILDLIASSVSTQTLSADKFAISPESTIAFISFIVIESILKSFRCS